MPVTEVRKDPAALTMTLHCEYDHPVDTVWTLWSDPRKLEKWWGPPTYPATFARLDLVPGGEAKYYMTSPEGTRYWGMWRIVRVDAPNGFEALDLFCDGDGNPDTTKPTSSMVVSLHERAGGGTVMQLRSTFPSLEAMEQLVAMGMEEGITLALGQADALLA